MFLWKDDIFRLKLMPGYLLSIDAASWLPKEMQSLF